MRSPYNYMGWFVTVFLSLCISIGNAYATTNSSDRFPSAQAWIEGIASTLDEVRKKSSLLVLFPTNVPMPKQKLFAFSPHVPNDNNYWEITVTNSPKCQTHGCVVGSLSAQKEGKLEKNYIQTLSPKVTYALKQKVKLKDNVIGYFTPGHAEADWHSPSIEWQMNKVLYVLNWEIKEDAKQALTLMANSAIGSGH